MTGHEKLGDGADGLPKTVQILHRRREENLPVFGELVEHADRETLVYHEHEDARNIELLFDLFFVAIFSTFTKNHEINSNEALSSYAVYFGVIWASWLQVCLYDVRFGADSIFERFTKAVQMCMFIGFASATGCLEMNPPKASAEKSKGDLNSFESLNVLMIVSRALFAVQYLAAYMLVGRKHPPAKPALLMTAGTYGIASLIYGLLFKFVLLDTGKFEGFYGYYAVIAFELIAVSFVVYRHNCVSFVNTHLHKRLMVLTLMILGEGVIVCAFSFAKISSKTGWTANSFGQALCVILSIYFMYCLYFGNSGIERARTFNAVKQQVYAMLHLPFHLALALTLEGLRTWTIIANVQYNFNKVYGYLETVIGAMPDVFRLGELPPEVGVKIVQTLNETATSFGFDKSDSSKSIQTALGKLALAFQNNAATLAAPVPGGGAQDKNGVLRFWFDEFVSLFQNEQFTSNSLVVPEVQRKAAQGSGIVQMEAYYAVFRMIFIYFFLCAGLVLILLAVFRSMSIGPRDKLDRIMIIFRIVVGMTLSLLGLMALMDSHVTSYIASGALLPTLLMALLLVVFLEKAVTIFAIMRGQKRGKDAEYGSLDELADDAATLKSDFDLENKKH